MSYQIIYINSKQRISGSNSDFYYKVELQKDNTFRYVTVLSALIPKSYYLIEDNKNTFTLIENTISYTVTITPGNYTRKAFQTELQTALNNAGNYSYSVSYPDSKVSADTGKFTITVSNNNNDQPQLVFSTYLYEQCGFDLNSTNTFINNSITSTNVIKLQKEDILYIHSDICQNAYDNILQEIFASGDPSYSNIRYQATAPNLYAKRLTTRNSNVYRFYLTDENSNKIELNGQNLVIVLYLY